MTWVFSYICQGFKIQLWKGMEIEFHIRKRITVNYMILKQGEMISKMHAGDGLTQQLRYCCDRTPNIVTELC
jgi:hypothetical protein